MIVKCIAIVFLTAVASACEDGMELEELPRRARNYALTGVEPPVSDFLLQSGWYNAYGPSGHYLMPDSSTMPSFDGCGTHQPIYLNGTHPEVLSETPVAAVACSRTFIDDCDAKYAIQIRNCSGGFQYFLNPTVRYSAYCFDPPAIQGATTFSPAPTNFEPGTITVTPTLVWTSEERGNVIINSPTLVFKCSFIRDATLLFKVSWYVNGHLRFSFGPTNVADDLDISTGHLVEKGFYLGINLQCGIQASVDQSGVPTVSQYSSEFFAGIQAVHSTMTLNSSHDSAVVQLKPTIPIGCTYIDGREYTCESKKLHVQMSNPDYTCESDGVQAFERCSAGIDLQNRSSTWDANAVYEFTVTSKFTTVESSTYSLYLQTDSGFSETSARAFIAGQQLQTITVIISRTGRSVRHSYSHVDPHMKTFDNSIHYESQDQGDFLFYRNKLYNIQVQERTRPCNNNRATCTCAVAIQAGSDVFIINRCPGTTKLNEFVLCNDGGTLDVVKNNEYSYTINTPIGTVIKISLWPAKYVNTYKDFMNIDVYSSPKDLQNTEGLCGYYDNNQNNDYKKRDGTVVSIAPGQKNLDFTDSWRLLPTENLFNHRNLENLQNWVSTNQLICICEQSFPFLPTGTAAVEESSSFCGPTQFAGCFKAKSITDKKCAKIVQRRKRSLSRKSNNIGLLSLLQPAVDVAYTHSVKRREEPSVLEYQLTDDDAHGNCTQIINNSPAAVAFPERIEEGQLTSLIDQCAFDVKAANDLSVGLTHSDSLNDKMKHIFSYEPTFAENNSESITTFLKQTCPNNCSSRGYCSDEGECVCDSQYHDPDCSLYVGDPIHVTVLPDEGICDTTLGDCRCSWFYTENLLDNFTCKIMRKQVNVFGTRSLVDEQYAQGNFDDRFTGQCCWQESRRRRSTDENVLGYEVEMYISNDGATYGNGQTLHVIDEACVEVVTNTSTGETGLSLKTGFCNIYGQCYADSENMVTDPCRSCRTGLDVYDWTNECATSSGDSKSYTVIIAVSVCIPVGLILVIAVVVGMCCKWPCRKDQAVSSCDYETRHVSHANARPVLDAKGNTFKTDPIPRLTDSSIELEHVYDQLYHDEKPSVLREEEEPCTIDGADNSPVPKRRERPQTAETLRGIQIDVRPRFSENEYADIIN